MAINWPDNTRTWANQVWRIVGEAERRWDVRCYTYANHGRPGMLWSIDFPVAPLGQRANAAQEALGDKIQEWAENNWYRLGIDYCIWWNWMKEDKYTRWFSYEPYAFKWKHGSPDPETRRHMDHFHMSCRPGFSYRPPG
jgi:hypothetical protein